MPLVAQDIDIVPTPSHILDGHYPDGNDHSQDVPLSWLTVLPILNKPTGTPYTINLFANYLTQPPGNTAVATLGSGSLTGGWTLGSNGDLSYDGSDVASLTISVTATRLGKAVTSNTFQVTSIAAASADNIAPTYPTGLTFLSKTPSSATFKVNPPMDPPTSTVAASGNKDLRLYVDNLLNKTIPIALGQSVRLSIAEFSSGPPARRYARAAFVDVNQGQISSANGIPNKGKQKTLGPASPGIQAIMARYYWKSLENATGTAYTMDNGTTPAGGMPTIYKLLQDIAAINIELAAETPARAPIGLYIMITVRSFGSNKGPGAMPAPAYLEKITYPFTDRLGHIGYMMARWDDVTYAPAFDRLVKEMGRLFGSNPNFLGVATQETANGGITDSNYTPVRYGDGLIAEGQSIFDASPYIRQWFYFNDMPGDGNRVQRQRVLTAMANFGAWAGGPDLLPFRTSLVNSDYKLYAPNIGKLPMFCSCQWDSFHDSHDGGHPLKDYTDWGIDGSGPINVASLPHGLGSASGGLDGISYVYTTDGAPWYFKDAMAGIATPSYPAVTYIPPAGGSGITPGHLVQTGTNYAITSYGSGISPTADEWSPARVPVSGNNDIIAIVDGVTGTDHSSCFGGLCFRETASAGSRVANLHISNARVKFEYRPTPDKTYTVVASVDGITLGVPCALWLNRTGNIFTAYYSQNFNTWTLIGATPALSMVNSIYAELYCAPLTDTPVTMTFKQVNIQNMAQISFTATAIPPGAHNFAVTSRDNAFNESIKGPAVAVTI